MTDLVVVPLYAKIMHIQNNPPHLICALHSNLENRLLFEFSETYQMHLINCNGWKSQSKQAELYESTARHIPYVMFARESNICHSAATCIIYPEYYSIHRNVGSTFFILQLK